MSLSLSDALKHLQNCFLRADTAKAFTTVLAGFALTIVILPKISLFPALVAGFTRVLILQSPGSVKMPFFFTSAVATAMTSASILLQTEGLTPRLSPSEAQSAALVSFPPAAFMAFMAFMGAAA